MSFFYKNYFSLMELLIAEEYFEAYDDWFCAQNL
jgi:hypothetical protein